MELQITDYIRKAESKASEETKKKLEQYQKANISASKAEIGLCELGFKLRTFEQLLQEKTFFEVFANLLNNPILPDDIKREEIYKGFVPQNGLKIVSINKWASSFKGSRIATFIVDQSAEPIGSDWTIGEKKGFNSFIGKTMFDIFGRENTLNEKLTRHFKKKKGKRSFVSKFSFTNKFEKEKISIIIKNDDSDDKVDMVIEVNKSFLQNISNCKYYIDECPLKKEEKDMKDSCIYYLPKCLQNLYVKLKPGTPPEMTRLIRRTIQRRFEGWKRLALSEILSSSKKSDFTKAVSILYGTEIDMQRQDTLCLKRFEDSADSVIDHETMLDFMSLIQAVYFLNWWAKDIWIIGYLPEDNENDDRSISTALLYDKDVDITSSGLITQLENSMKVFEDGTFPTIRDWRGSVKSVLRAVEDWGFIESAIRKAVNEDDEAIKGLSNLFKVSKDLCNEMHEGKPLRFVLMYSSGSAWPYFEETLSIEDKVKLKGDVKDQEFSKPDDLKKVMVSNYSIFQYPRVVAFIDRNHYPLGLGITEIVRLKDIQKPSSVTEYQLYRRITEKGNVYIVYAGQGNVRLYFNGKEKLRWIPSRRGPHEEEFKGNLEENLEEWLKNSLGEIAQEKRGILIEVFQAISDTIGEGAIFIFGEKVDLDNYLRDMDIDEMKMNWTQCGKLCFMDHTILKAMAIRDGATFINKDAKMVESRKSIHLFEQGKAYLLIIDEKNYELSGNKEKWDKYLGGRGTRHLNAASICYLLKKRGASISVFTISADGPITPWHQVLS